MITTVMLVALVTMAFVFEGLELSLQHVLPNFAECWWDRYAVAALSSINSCTHHPY